MKLKHHLILLTTLALTTEGVAAQPANPDRIYSQSGIRDLGQIPGRVFKALMIFLPAIATVYLALSGYRYIIAQGNPDLVEKAKKSLTYAVYGVIISYAAVLIIYTISDQFDFKTGFSL